MKSPRICMHEAEGRMALFVELTCDDMSVIGCSSMDVDYSKDITEKLLEKAVISAYKKVRIIERGA